MKTLTTIGLIALGIGLGVFTAGVFIYELVTNMKI